MKDNLIFKRKTRLKTSKKWKTNSFFLKEEELINKNGRRPLIKTRRRPKKKGRRPPKYHQSQPQTK